MKPLCSWQGGKSSLLKYLLPLLPTDAKCYVEVFGGGGAVLLAKPIISGQVEVYNDNNTALVNVFRQAKHHPEALIRELQMMLGSREEMRRYLSRQALTEIQQAAEFLHCRLISFGSDGTSFGVAKTPGGGASNSKENMSKRIIQFAKRFDRVAVECLEWERLIKLYDKDSTFFFIDPPYVGCKTKSYAAWTLADVGKLRAVLDGIRGRWLATFNDMPAIRDIFHGCDITAVERGRGIKTGFRYHEIIIRPFK